MNIKMIIIVALATWNLLTFFLMGIDKYKAQKGKRRVNEKTLFLLSFLLGGIGIWCAMYAFRHKTKHWSFKILIPIAVLINVGVCFYIYARM